MTRKDLTRFERARILGARAIQISMGARPLVEIKKVGSLDPIDIAYSELEAGVLPLNVVREDEEEKF
ncbi:MAG: DNA-directed RNA polymerase subunit K [Methanobrevibacter wolinii]|uniref:DNA-directed RNA polymerase subunit K n=1 Tax=Methanobrevibacter wolinii TaxID=190977 RepID=UPI0005B267CD|nr:DNA-directed RNA polymerase subunit K [Methanobrevibacter wolinii]MDD5959343.1 DNA-directed RNA polymerase subunit K [Methanobrevibacter wolinii]